jgi:hypothetical protein
MFFGIEMMFWVMLASTFIVQRKQILTHFPLISFYFITDPCYESGFELGVTTLKKKDFLISFNLWSFFS